jgi:hypothetical protein
VRSPEVFETVALLARRKAYEWKAEESAADGGSASPDGVIEPGHLLVVRSRLQPA